MELNIRPSIALLSLLACVFAVAAAEPKEAFTTYHPRPAARPTKPIPALPGPHLFIDDAEIETSRNLSRVLNHPQRDPAIPNPIVTSKQDRIFQPFFTVLRDADTGKFRLWYGAATEKHDTEKSRLAYMTSDDGIHWDRPTKILDQPAEIRFGSEVIDRGKNCPDPTARYVYSYFLGGGLRIAVSPDGLAWRPLVDGVVLNHDHDIDNVSCDDLRHRWVATYSSMRTSPHFTGKRRTTLQSFSDDLIHWRDANIVLSADGTVDQGQLQFYAMSAYLTRGPLRIGMVKVLRDDVPSDPPDLLKQRRGGKGTGYTSLAWSRDGVHWVRDTEKFFDRGPGDVWDHSHAWIDEQVIVADKLYLYYAGYRAGHKANRFEDRQLGLVVMPLDRYIDREPTGDAAGYLKTIPIELPKGNEPLAINANAAGGSIRLRLCDAEGRAIRGFDFDNSVPITADGLRLPVKWNKAEMTPLHGRTIQIEFEIRHAKLYAFDFPEREAIKSR